MSEGSTQDEEERRRAQGPAPGVPGNQSGDSEQPLWPGQQAPAQAQPKATDGAPLLSFPEGARQLQLPSKPKSPGRTNLQIGGAAVAPEQTNLPAPPSQQNLQNPQQNPEYFQQNQPQQFQQNPQPVQHQIHSPGPHHQVHQQSAAQPGQTIQNLNQDLGTAGSTNSNLATNPNINTNPFAGAGAGAGTNSGVGQNTIHTLQPRFNVGLPNLDAEPVTGLNTGAGVDPKSPLVGPIKPATPVITSASAKPDWTQPQWPGAKSGAEANYNIGQSPRPVIHSGNQAPPALTPQPQTPYSKAPPKSGPALRNLFSPQNSPYALTGNQTNPGLKSQIPFTIRRDLTLAKQLFGDQTRKKAHEYKQTEYIPKAPTIRVSTRDPDRPWTPAPATQFEFYSEEEERRRQAFSQQQQQPINQNQTVEPQFPRGFAHATQPEKPIVYDEEGPPDPRYAPFQNELAKDIARQDKLAARLEQEAPLPEDRRERGAAAIRALGRNSDKFYDQDAERPPERSQPVIRLTRGDVFGLITYYFLVTREVLLTPSAFFANMSMAGGLNDPLLYLAFTSIMTGILIGVAKLNILTMFLTVITTFLSVAVGAVLIQLIFKKMGGEGKFEQTFNVLAYSKATFVMIWISLGPFPIGLIAATIFTAYLNYLGLSRVHKLSSSMTGIIIAVMAGLPLMLKLLGKQ